MRDSSQFVAYVRLYLHLTAKQLIVCFVKEKSFDFNNTPFSNKPLYSYTDIQ